LETWHPTPRDDDIMDQHDHDEMNICDAATDPDQFFQPPTKRVKKFDSILEVPDICLIPPLIEKMLELHPAQDDAYEGDSLLRFSPLPMQMHPALKKPSRIKRNHHQQLHMRRNFTPL
jgi:hypothetical protein